MNFKNTFILIFILSTKCNFLTNVVLQFEDNVYIFVTGVGAGVQADEQAEIKSSNTEV